jgi:hypothetical protein
MIIYTVQYATIEDPYHYTPNVQGLLAGPEPEHHIIAVIPILTIRCLLFLKIAEYLVTVL